MNHATSPFNDPAEFNSASIGPELPQDSVEDLFLDAKLRVKLPTDLVPFTAMINWWAKRVFAEFWKDYEEQEGCTGSHQRNDELAINLIQAITGSRNRKMAMRAECYLAVVNRKPESQTVIAKKYGVTRAAISKICVQIRDELGPEVWMRVGLPAPARHMKSDTARESYRKRALRIHKERKDKLCKQQMKSPFHSYWN